MAITPFKTFSSGEILTASDLNSSFTTITNAGADVVFPALEMIDLDGFELVLDADGDTSITSDTDDQIDFRANGTDYFRLTAGRFMALAAAIVEAEGVAVASAATTDIWANDGNTVHITGTTTITSFGTAPQAGAWKKVIFDGALTLTHGANLYIPGAANITTAADDIAFVYADTTTQFDILYFKRDGTATVASAGAASTLTGTTLASNVVSSSLTTVGTLAAVTITGGTITGITDLTVADGGTGVSTFTDGGVLVGNAANAVQVTSAGTAGQVLTSNGAGVDPTFQSRGRLVQMVSTTTGAVATGTTAIPGDDTIPQITEGDQYMTLAITPLSASNTLVIEVSAFMSSSGGSAVRWALFQDATANALAAGGDESPGNASLRHAGLTHTMTAGTTSATTFRFRMGIGSGTLTFNGVSGGRYFGGVCASSIVIREIAA